MIKVSVVQIGTEALQRFPQLASVEARFLIARNIMEGARAKLIKIASERLHATRADYIAGIQPIERDGKSVVLALVGKLPNMIENGWEGGFMHEFLLSDEVSGWKISAEGNRYRSIPFRHKAPGSGPQGGQPMGSQFASQHGVSRVAGGGSEFGLKNTMSNAAPHTVIEDTRALGKKIHGRAKKLITKSEAKAGQKGPTALRAGLAPKLRPHHTTDIFAGMIVNKQAVQKKDGSVGHQKTYTTFRTISEGRPDTFFHPGIQARDFMGELDSYIQQVAPGAVAAYLAEVLK